MFRLARAAMRLLPAHMLFSKRHFMPVPSMLLDGAGTVDAAGGPARPAAWARNDARVLWYRYCGGLNLVGADRYLQGNDIATLVDGSFQGLSLLSALYVTRPAPTARMLGESSVVCGLRAMGWNTLQCVRVARDGWAGRGD